MLESKWLTVLLMVLILGISGFTLYSLYVNKESTCTTTTVMGKEVLTVCE